MRQGMRRASEQDAKRARPKLTPGVLGTKGVCEKKKVKLEMNGKRTAQERKKKGSATCWYALGVRRTCAKVCDKPLSKMREASASQTNAAGSGNERRLRKGKR